MNNKFKKHLRAVAEYDTENIYICKEYGYKYIHNNSLWSKDLRDLHYHDKIEWLWPVAKKVVFELMKLCSYDDRVFIVNDILIMNNTFDTMKLFTAVYAGIELINKTKK